MHNETAYILSKVAPSAFEGGRILAFSEQVNKYLYKETSSGELLVVAEAMSSVGLQGEGIPDRPLLINQSVLEKIVEVHEIGYHDLGSLPQWLAGHPLAMESISDKGGLVVIADAVDKHQNDIIVAIHFNERKGSDGWLINEVASVYGKAGLAYLIENTVRLKKEIYVNRSTSDWLVRAGLRLPEDVACRLQEYCSRFSGHISATAHAANEASVDPVVPEAEIAGYQPRPNRRVVGPGQVEAEARKHKEQDVLPRHTKGARR
jgi:hypothetical protein